MKTSDSKDINLKYYLSDSPGRSDYWRRMAAPRFRMSTFLSLMKDAPPRSVVDLGCGSGELLGEIGRVFPRARLCGIDLSSKLVEVNRERNPDIEWHTMDLACDQNFEPSFLGEFDVVMASEIIEHVDDPKAFLQNASRLAKPGSGRLMLSTQSGKIWQTEICVGHKRHFSREEMEGLLRSSGWNPLRVWNAGFPFHSLAKRAANISPERTMRAFSEKPYSTFQNAVCIFFRAVYLLNSNNRGAQLFALAGSAHGNS